MMVTHNGGDPGWIRTIDLPLRRRPLYPLSYEAMLIIAPLSLL